MFQFLAVVLFQIASLTPATTNITDPSHSLPASKAGNSITGSGGWGTSDITGSGGWGTSDVAFSGRGGWGSSDVC